MPNKTIYLKDEDLRVFNRAQELGGESVSAIVTQALRRYVDQEEEKIAQEQDSENVEEIVNGIFREALARNASDIHIQPTSEGNSVRFRIDGVLQESNAIPTNLYSQVIVRIQQQTSQEINNLPQNSIVSLEMEDKKIQLRTSTLPTISGPSIVMRVLDTDISIPPLTELEPDGKHGDQLKKLIAQQHGLIFVTGPTGSGKTTLLYCMLKHLNRKQIKIMTVENPVEVIIDGCVQVPLERTTGDTFASLLPSVLRSDPDVVMVGEIRDMRTAQLCVEMALTGHLVFSVLHTTSAAAAFKRLIDIGIEPFLVRDSVVGVVGQRLVRKFCSACKKETEVKHPRLEKFIKLGSRFFESSGCEQCAHHGYRGRLPLVEILRPDSKLKQAITQEIDITQLTQLAEDAGMKSLLQDGIEKASQGYTSLSEVLRVLA